MISSQAGRRSSQPAQTNHQGKWRSPGPKPSWLVSPTAQSCTSRPTCCCSGLPRPRSSWLRSPTWVPSRTSSYSSEPAPIPMWLTGTGCSPLTTPSRTSSWPSTTTLCWAHCLCTVLGVDKLSLTDQQLMQIGWPLHLGGMGLTPQLSLTKVAHCSSVADSAGAIYQRLSPLFPSWQANDQRAFRELPLFFTSSAKESWWTSSANDCFVFSCHQKWRLLSVRIAVMMLWSSCFVSRML